MKLFIKGNCDKKNVVANFNVESQSNNTVY